MRGTAPKDDLLAAERALGLLLPGEARRVEARMGAEPALRGAGARWERRLVALLEAMPEVAPPRALRRRARARALPPARGGWVRGGLLAALLGGGALAAAALLAPLPALDGPAAVLRGDAVVMRARLDGRGGLHVDLQGEAPPGRVLELWVIAEGAAPRSLGVVEPGAAVLKLAGIAVPPGAVLALSEEPPGGAPDGAPTGAVVASGTVGA
ncbi:anti-sigma factor domain-containing protein [Jannaschia sp. W003]|uniref:anti-sigma factor domain-containing protein n=1 Tax=Jannaschia sp. W003 TaxID=2867012 RepID=UPI0021A3C179|nr:anti-sigma factor [Jannaschia sp. W003]UWQ22213.1 anti-sigma factor [Jannaschia sp. W003]